jgi:hypothetical protein
MVSTLPVLPNGCGVRYVPIAFAIVLGFWRCASRAPRRKGSDARERRRGPCVRLVRRRVGGLLPAHAGRLCFEPVRGALFVAVGEALGEGPAKEGNEARRSRQCGGSKGLRIFEILAVVRI